MRLLQLKYWKWVVFINFMSLCKANMALGKFVAKNWTRMGKKRDIQYSNFSPLLISKAQEKEKIGVDLWCIWQSWNTKLWEEKDTSPVVAFSLAMQTLHQWQQLNSVHQTHQPSTSKNNTQWTPPPHNFLKCNLDAAIFNDNNLFGVGICLRDNNGCFFKAITLTANGKPTLKEVEAWALHKAIKWTQQLNIHNIIFEMDCKSIVDNLVVNFKGSIDYHALLQKCKANLSNLLNSKVSFVKM